MYEFNYDCIKNKYVNNSKPLFTDTGKLMYRIKTEDVYEDFGREKICLILVIVPLSQSNMLIQTNKSMEKEKMKPEELRLKNLLD